HQGRFLSHGVKFLATPRRGMPEKSIKYGRAASDTSSWRRFANKIPHAVINRPPKPQPHLNVRHGDTSGGFCCFEKPARHVQVAIIRMPAAINSQGITAGESSGIPNQSPSFSKSGSRALFTKCMTPISSPNRGYSEDGI